MRRWLHFCLSLLAGVLASYALEDWGLEKDTTFLIHLAIAVPVAVGVYWVTVRIAGLLR